MAKDRWVTNEKIDNWLEQKLTELEEWGGPGSAVDALANYIDDNHFMSLCTEGLKAIDIFEQVNGGVQFGQDAEKMDCKIFYTYFGGINYWFLAKNTTEFKKLITKAVNEYKEACEPIGDPEPTKNERLKSLLEEIRNSHIGDPKGQSEQEAAWCAEIDELVELL